MNHINLHQLKTDIETHTKAHAVRVVTGPDGKQAIRIDNTDGTAIICTVEDECAIETILCRHASHWQRGCGCCGETLGVYDFEEEEADAWGDELDDEWLDDPYSVRREFVLDIERDRR